MSNIDDAIRKVAARNLTGKMLTAAGPVETKGFIRVGITINRDAVNKIFAQMNYKTLKAKYDVLKRFAQHLAWLSPVYTGYYVWNWQVNTGVSRPTTNVSQEPSPVGIYIQSGSLRKKYELQGAEKDIARQHTADRLTDSIENRFLAYSGTNTTTLKDTWAFYNPTPYADHVESKHGVVEGAIDAIRNGV